jgi:hypothetical protein
MAKQRKSHTKKQCTVEHCASPHQFEHDKTREHEPPYPEGYDLCGRIAADPIHDDLDWDTEDLS